MSILTFPNISPDSLDFGLMANTQSMDSELNGASQTLGLPGDKWSATLTYSNRQGADARVLRAFLASLRGGAGRFYLSPPDYVRTGAGGGTPLVKGAAQTGSTLTIDGCTQSVSGWLQIGDYFQIGNELKMITVDANSDIGGNATLTFTPPIRTSPADNGAVIITSPTCIMKLSDGNQARWQVQAPVIYALSIACEEALT